MPPLIGLYERIDRDTSPEPNTGCWLWTGKTNRKGYARIQAGESGGPYPRLKMLYVHRVNYVRFVGSIPNGLLLRHRCDVPCCVSPYHVHPGTSLDNYRVTQLREVAQDLTGNQNSKMPMSYLYERSMQPERRMLNWAGSIT